MAKEGIKPIIVAYLEDRAKNDELFAKAYAKENKSIDECIEYIFGEASRMGNAVCVSDAEVFGWAVHYYDEDNIKINKTAAARRKAAAGIDDIELTDEEKAKLREQAEKEYKAKIMSDLRMKDLEAKKARAERKREQQKEVLSLMGSLF